METTVDAARNDAIYRPMWLTCGLIPLLAGLDKFFNVLTVGATTPLALA